jgi:hypothetical protein
MGKRLTKHNEDDSPETPKNNAINVTMLTKELVV